MVKQKNKSKCKTGQDQEFPNAHDGTNPFWLLW